MTNNLSYKPFLADAHIALHVSKIKICCYVSTCINYYRWHQEKLFKYIEFWRGSCILHVMSVNNQLECLLMLSDIHINEYCRIKYHYIVPSLIWTYVS